MIEDAQGNNYAGYSESPVQAGDWPLLSGEQLITSGDMDVKTKVHLFDALDSKWQIDAGFLPLSDFASPDKIAPLATRMTKGAKTVIKLVFPDGSETTIGGKRAERANTVIMWNVNAGKWQPYGTRQEGTVSAHREVDRLVIKYGAKYGYSWDRFCVVEVNGEPATRVGR